MTPPLADLLAQIYATPDDLALRSIYADALIAAGDARGDFIAHQLAGHPAADLLAPHARTWAGRIAACTDPIALGFIDGFLAEVTITLPPALNRLAWHRIARAPEWATVRRLHLADSATNTAAPAHLAGILHDAPLRALRELHAPHELLHELRPDDRFTLLRTLHVEIESEPFAIDAALARGAHLTVTRTRWCSSDPVDLRAWAHGVARLELRHLYPYADRNTQLVAHALQQATPRPPVVVYVFHERHITIERDALHVVLHAPPDERRHRARVLLAPFHAVLPMFARVRAGYGAAGHEAALFDGTGAHAQAETRSRAR